MGVIQKAVISIIKVWNLKITGNNILWRKCYDCPSKWKRVRRSSVISDQHFFFLWHCKVGFEIGQVNHIKSQHTVWESYESHIYYFFLKRAKRLDVLSSSGKLHLNLGKWFHKPLLQATMTSFNIILWNGTMMLGSGLVHLQFTTLTAFSHYSEMQNV